MHFVLPCENRPNRKLAAANGRYRRSIEGCSRDLQWRVKFDLRLSSAWTGGPGWRRVVDPNTERSEFPGTELDPKDPWQ